VQRGVTKLITVRVDLQAATDTARSNHGAL
jgi:hypothetical protein